MSNIIKKNGKYFCKEHNRNCEWCRNKTTKQYFVKCPENTEFECGTKTISDDEVRLYEMYSPNYTVPDNEKFWDERKEEYE